MLKLRDLMSEGARGNEGISVKLSAGGSRLKTKVGDDETIFKGGVRPPIRVCLRGTQERLRAGMKKLRLAELFFSTMLIASMLIGEDSRYAGQFLAKGCTKCRPLSSLALPLARNCFHDRSAAQVCAANQTCSL